MNRRDLMTMFGAAVGSTLLLPTRSIFLPPRGGWPMEEVYRGTYDYHIAAAEWNFDIEGAPMRSEFALLEPNDYVRIDGRLCRVASIDSQGVLFVPARSIVRVMPVMSFEA